METGAPILELQQTAGNAAVTLTPLQHALAPHVDAITTFWIVLWVLTGLFLLYKLWVEYREQRRAK